MSFVVFVLAHTPEFCAIPGSEKDELCVRRAFVVVSNYDLDKGRRVPISGDLASVFVMTESSSLKVKRLNNHDQGRKGEQST